MAPNWAGAADLAAAQADVVDRAAAVLRAAVVASPAVGDAAASAADPAVVAERVAVARDAAVPWGGRAYPLSVMRAAIRACV